MNLSFCNVNYRTERYEDRKAGCVGFNLFATAKGQTTAVATITFWDAVGQFYLKLNGPEIPLDVIERFISEARQQIPIS
jgi:hypothetical protein